MADSPFLSGFVTGFGSAFLQFVFERFASVSSFAWEEMRLIQGVDDEHCQLEMSFLRLQKLMNCMEASALRFLPGGDVWQKQFIYMNKLAYDADALLDHVSLQRSNYGAEDPNEMQVLTMVLSSFDNLNFPSKIFEVRKKIDELATKWPSFVELENVFQRITSRESSQSSNFYSTGPSSVDDRTMVGRVRDKECIVDLLSKECESSNFSVISIVGMGGIGKTALTELVWHDDNVLGTFNLRIWVSISMGFDAVRILKSIIENATRSVHNFPDLDERILHATQSLDNFPDPKALRDKLEVILRGKKFLLVLDDYWSEEDYDWDTLCSPFRSGERGSKVIVTTRSTKVSSIVRSSEAYNLEILSDGDCWELIKKRALITMETSQDLKEKIAKKCKGLPLVAMKLGSMLRGKSEDEWRTILDDELWDMPEGKNILLCLMRSYLYLPAHLQKCFAYCSIFPQNREFEVEELILLWMAEGFIRPVGARRLEDIGIEYFDDLYSRSLFQQCSTPNGIKYKMHDLIHDMAKLVSKGIYFHYSYNTSDCFPLFGDNCHLSLHHDNLEELELKASRENKRLRTFLFTRTAGMGHVQHKLFKYLQFLRVLGLSRVGLKELPDNFDELKYLRYLNLSVNSFTHLPKSVCKLLALQVLKLRDCFALRELPEDMKNLFNLRHLDLDVRALRRSMPPEFGRLTNLQSLSAFIVGTKKGCGIEQLENLNCLRGSLCIQNIENVSNAADAIKAKLDQKTGLNKLELHWRKLPNAPDSLSLEVLRNLQPHENLKELVIENYCGILYPDWLSQPWRKFTSIHLQGLKYCDKLPSLGELPSLKSFVISDMPCLEYVDHNFYGSSNSEKFPRLESFELHNMELLIEWINVSDTAMPWLDYFTVDNCPNFEKLPPKLQSLLPSSKNISNCPKLQVLP